MIITFLLFRSHPSLVWDRKWKLLGISEEGLLQAGRTSRGPAEHQSNEASTVED